MGKKTFPGLCRDAAMYNKIGLHGLCSCKALRVFCRDTIEILFG